MDSSWDFLLKYRNLARNFVSFQIKGFQLGFPFEIQDSGYEFLFKIKDSSKDFLLKCMNLASISFYILGNPWGPKPKNLRENKKNNPGEPLGPRTKKPSRNQKKQKKTKKLLYFELSPPL